MKEAIYSVDGKVYRYGQAAHLLCEFVVVVVVVVDVVDVVVTN